MKQKYFTNVVWKEGKYFVAQCLNVDVSSFGKSHEEALKNLDEAIELYLKDNPNENVTDIEMPSLTISSLGRAYA